MLIKLLNSISDFFPPRRQSTTVYCQFEIGQYLQGHGVPEEKVVTFNIGGTVDIGEGCKATMVWKM